MALLEEPVPKTRRQRGKLPTRKKERKEMSDKNILLWRVAGVFDNDFLLSLAFFFLHQFHHVLHQIHYYQQQVGSSRVKLAVKSIQSDVKKNQICVKKNE
eukprot:GHVP01044475.1.p1 GENE.GHVP01044475.1~~GHVP01044475.1.p1  ORF type:complete len:100 (-),score=22.84 GHVP01044475.1:630-929(-)